MPGATQLLIVLDTPTGSYFAGQLVTGRLLLHLESEKKTKGLKIVCNGRASVSWTESHTETVQTGSGSDARTESRTVTRTYSASENYFQFKTYFAGSSGGGQEIQLPAGDSVYPFTFQLPLGIPSSFQGRHGYVQYRLQATLKRSWAFDKSTSCPFTVNGILDLNTWPGAGGPSTFTKSKTLGCCCCKSGPISITATIHRVGLVPGEPLGFIADIVNNSHKPTMGIFLRITRHVTFHAQGRTNSESDRIWQYRGPGVAAGESDTFRLADGEHRIPAVPPTDLAGCRIITVKYQLEIELDMPRGHFNLKGTLPLIIGTIPFRNNFQYVIPQQPSVPFGFPAAGGGDALAPSAPPQQLIPGYPDLPPPSYESTIAGISDKAASASAGDLPTYGEAVKQTGDGDEKGQVPQFDRNFVPKYATYGWGPSHQ